MRASCVAGTRPHVVQAGAGVEDKHVCLEELVSLRAHGLVAIVLVNMVRHASLAQDALACQALLEDTHASPALVGGMDDLPGEGSCAVANTACST